MLSDWTDENPHSLLKKLKNSRITTILINQPLALFPRREYQGLSATIADRKMWAEMKMNPTDLADVSGYTYTYLMNGQAPLKNWTGLFRPGEKIRLRFINGSAMTYFDIRIPGLKMTVVAADGQYVNPVTVDEFRIAVAETYDVIVEPQVRPIPSSHNLWTGPVTLAGHWPREGLSAVVPALDPRPLLTMEDMGMGGMGHDMAGMDHSQMGGMDNSGEMMSMDGADLADSGTSSAPMDHSSMAGMDHSQMAGMPGMQSHPASETDNPLVDMQAMSVSPKLNDPGIGLRNNGRKVLTYADLKSRFEDLTDVNLAAP